MKQYARNFLYIMAGNLMLTFGTVAFLEPTGIISGGTTGVGLFLLNVFHVPMAVTFAVVNVASFLLGLFVLGKRFALTTLLSSVLAPVFIRLFEAVPALSALTGDFLLCAILAGVLAGLGVGLVIRAGASTGGLDIPPLVLNRKLGVSVGAVMLAENVIILAFQLFISRPEQILYGIVQVALTSLTVDWITLSGKKQAQLLIISPRHEEIRSALLSQADVGLSLLQMETGYSRIAQQAVLCAVPPRKLPRVEDLAAGIDPACFMLVSSVNEVRGRGFSRPR